MYKLIDTIEGYQEAINELEPLESLALDTETYVLDEYKHLKELPGALDCHTSSVSILSLCGRDTEVYIFDIIELERKGYDYVKLGELLMKKEFIVAHNAKFDCKFIRVITGVMLEKWWCTNIAYNLLGNAHGSKFYRQATSYSLKNMVRDLLGIHLKGKGKEQIEDWSVRPLEDNKLKYAARDILYLFRCKDILEEVLTKPLPQNIGDDYGLGMAHIVDLEMKLITVTAEMEYNGLPVGRQVLREYENKINNPNTGVGEMQKVAGEIAQQLNLAVEPSVSLDVNYLVPTRTTLQILNSSTRMKEILSNQLGVSLDTAQYAVINRIVDLLNESESDFYCDDEALRYKELKALEDTVAKSQSKLLKNILLYKRLQKQDSMNLSKYVHPITGRIHFSLNQVAAATGRSSSQSPNCQNLSSKVKLQLTKTFEVFDKKLLYSQDALACEDLDDMKLEQLRKRIKE